MTGYWYVVSARVLSSSMSVCVCVATCVLVSLFQLNPGRQGFYRVSYSTDLFSPLLPALRDGSLPPQDRLGILNDAFALVGESVVVLV